MKKKIVIVGATSAMAEHCARLWLQARDGVNLTLVGRDAQRLSRVAQDLRVRNPASTVHTVEVDFMHATAIQQMVADLFALGGVDVALIAHGSLPDQIECQTDLHANHEALSVNGISPVLFAEAFAQRMASANHGTLALIGSVAGDRGRKSNYVYGAAKGMVARYAQGLQHRFAGSEVNVVLIKPGPTDTPMTAHLKQEGSKLAPVTVVAKDIVQAIATGRQVVYSPRKWQLIMLIIRHLPAFVFAKLNI